MIEDANRAAGVGVVSNHEAAAPRRPAGADEPREFPGSVIRTTMDTIPAVIDALERAPGIVVPLVRAVPAAVLRRRPGPGRWSAHEHACHLAVVHAIFFDRLDQILSSPAPVVSPYDPGNRDTDDALLRRDLDESLEAYVRDRARLVWRLAELTPDDWRKTAEHEEYSHYSVFIMFRHLALHDFLHAYRIEEILLKRDWGSA